LPNIEVPGNGQLTVEYLVRDVTLSAGPATLFDGDGSALVVHEGKDDYLTDPAGNAGNRIACGPLVR
jgi:Cu-Zn family superoxide dismutase